MMKKMGGGGGESGCDFLQIINKILILHPCNASLWYDCARIHQEVGKHD
jgi:hypothetical protein